MLSEYIRKCDKSLYYHKYCHKYYHTIKGLRWCEMLDITYNFKMSYITYKYEINS